MESSSPSFITQTFGGRTSRETIIPAEPSAGNTLEEQGLGVKIFTLNINGEDLPDDMDSEMDFEKFNPDLLVFCFQEVIELSITSVAQDLVSGRNRGERCDRLRQQLRSSIPSKFQEVHAEEMVGLFIIAFCNAEVSASMQYAQSAIYATGMGGLGNKGACSIRLRIADTTLVFVNAHLASSEAELERRNEDLLLIEQNLSFPVVPNSEKSVSWKKLRFNKVTKGYGENKMLPTNPQDIVLESRESKTESKHRFSILDSDYLFVAGDLNYRIELDHNQVLNLIKQQSYEELLQYDQLRAQSSRGGVCSPYKEARINFRPTYKFDKTHDADRQYDTSGKRRTPSWTDRILYRLGKAETRLQVESYTSHEGIRCSDHLPVSLSVKLACE